MNIYKIKTTKSLKLTLVATIMCSLVPLIATTDAYAYDDDIEFVCHENDAGEDVCISVEDLKIECPLSDPDGVNEYCAGLDSDTIFLDIPTQLVDLDGDGRREQFEAEVVLFNNGVATGRVQIDQAFFVKIERGTTSSFGGTELYGQLYHTADINTPLDDIHFAVQMQAADRKDDDDSEYEIFWSVIDSTESRANDDVDVPDCIIWDILGAPVKGQVSLFH